MDWNIVTGHRELFENAHQAGLTAIHATLVYWENTEESFEKINRIWHRLFKEHHDIIVSRKDYPKIFWILKKIIKLQLFLVFKILLLLRMIYFLIEKFFDSRV